MIKSDIGHIVFFINPQHNAFYRDLFLFLGWTLWYDVPEMVGVGNERGGSLWFSGVLKAVANDYDGPGVNHVGISVSAQADVDAVVAYLTEHGVPALFETPRHRPDFSSEGQTYYQVMFESPDRILFEVVYTGPMTPA
jgi:catechol 2,3-dioxygenase-like lactoylglutathione lyase family enzyme